MIQRILLFLLIFGLGQFALAQQKFSIYSPAGVVAQLYPIYKNNDFRKALELCTGKEKEKVQKVLDAMNRNFGKPPKEVILFAKSIDELKIINERIEGQYARVDVIWILKYHDKKNPAEYQVKVSEVAYLLEKPGDKWLIRGSKFLREHVLYDREKIEEIYKRAQAFEEVSGEKK